MALRRFHTIRRPPLLLAALLAMLVQLVLGGAASGGPSPAQLAALDAASILCTGAPPADHGPRHRHPPAPALCPAAVALAQPAVLPAPAPVPAPVSVAMASHAGERPPGRGPPHASARVGRPRAPPSLA